MKVKNYLVLFPRLRKIWTLSMIIVCSISNLFLKELIFTCAIVGLLGFEDLTSFKGTLMQIWNIQPISYSSHENNIPTISHYNAFYLLRYTHARYVKSMFTNTQKQQNMLKISWLLVWPCRLFSFLHKITC